MFGLTSGISLLLAFVFVMVSAMIIVIIRVRASVMGSVTFRVSVSGN